MTGIDYGIDYGQWLMVNYGNMIGVGYGQWSMVYGYTMV